MAVYLSIILLIILNTFDMFELLETIFINNFSILLYFAFGSILFDMVNIKVSRKLFLSTLR